MIAMADPTEDIRRPIDPDSWLPLKRTFSIAEAAHYMECSEVTVYRKIESGIIPTHLTIKPYRIRREVLVKILSQKFQS